MKCFIGLDLGTSAVKGTLLSQDGKILASASSGFSYSDIGLVRYLSPERFIESCFEVIKTLSASAGNGYEICGICPCCASGNLIFLDENRQPLTDIIGWQSSVDEKEYSQYYSEEDAKKVYETVGWPTLNGFPVAFFPWYAKNKPEIIKKSKTICMSAEYLNFVLTGEFGISHSMGTPFYLIDQKNGCYDKPTLEKWGIKEEQLPKIMSKGTVLGTVKKCLSDELGLPENTKTVLGSFDHPSGATGAGVYDEGDVLLSFGTSWVAFFPLNEREKAINAGYLTDLFMLDGNKYCAMSSIASIGEKIDELRNGILGNVSFADYDTLVTGAEKGCGGLRFLFDGKDAERAKGYNRCQIARAILESAAELLKKRLEDAEKKGLRVENITVIGGITNAPVCIQVICDTLGCKIKTVNGKYAGSVGAAMLAGIGTGVYKNEKDAFVKCAFPEKIYIPQ